MINFKFQLFVVSNFYSSKHRPWMIKISKPAFNSTSNFSLQKFIIKKIYSHLIANQVINSIINLTNKSIVRWIADESSGSMLSLSQGEERGSIITPAFWPIKCRVTWSNLLQWHSVWGCAGRGLLSETCY